MLNCLQAHVMISRRLDGELPPALSNDLGAHLESCPDCRKVAAADESISRRLRRGLDVPPAALDRLQEAILAGASAQPEAPPSRIPFLRFGARWTYPLTAAAAMVLGMAIGAYFFWPRIVGPETLARSGPEDVRSRAEPAAPDGSIPPTLVIEKGRQDLTPIYSETEPPMMLRTQQDKKIYFIDATRDRGSPGAPPNRSSQAFDPNMRLELEKVNQKMYQVVNNPWH